MMEMADKENRSFFYCENFSLSLSISPSGFLYYAHKSFFLSFCSFFLLWSLFEVWYYLGVPWLALWFWAVCWSRGNILLNYTPDGVKGKIDPHPYGHPLAPQSIYDPSSNKVPPIHPVYLAFLLQASLPSPHLSLRGCFALNTVDSLRNVSHL